jgi:hypothetical protein
MTTFIPVIELPHHGHCLRVRRPHGKISALLPRRRHRMRTELGEQAMMRPLIEEVEIVLRQQRHIERHRPALLVLPRGVGWGPAEVVYVHSSPMTCLSRAESLATEG